MIEGVHPGGVGKILISAAVVTEIMVNNQEGFQLAQTMAREQGMENGIQEYVRVAVVNPTDKSDHLLSQLAEPFHIH